MSWFLANKNFISKNERIKDLLKYPELKLVIAWNQPMLRLGTKYIFGISAAKNHILISPWSANLITKFAPKMKDLDVKKKTIGVPNDWEIDSKLLLALVKARLAE